jgi:hypothetical protein
VNQKEPITVLGAPISAQWESRLRVSIRSVTVCRFAVLLALGTHAQSATYKGGIRSERFYALVAVLVNSWIIVGSQSVAVIAVSGARFLSGMVEIKLNFTLIANSIAGKIWRFSPVSDKINTWLANPLLASESAKQTMQPCANGFKVSSGLVYISNLVSGTIHLIQLSGGMPKGALDFFATTGSVDDFTFLADSTIATATHGSKLICIGKDGAAIDILPDGCDACASVTTFGLRHDLIALTNGNMLEGGNTPARVLRVASPV